MKIHIESFTDLEQLDDVIQTLQAIKQQHVLSVLNQGMLYRMNKPSNLNLVMDFLDKKKQEGHLDDLWRKHERNTPEFTDEELVDHERFLDGAFRLGVEEEMKDDDEAFKQKVKEMINKW